MKLKMEGDHRGTAEMLVDAMAAWNHNSAVKGEEAYEFVVLAELATIRSCLPSIDLKSPSLHPEFCLPFRPKQCCWPSLLCEKRHIWMFRH